MPEGMEELLEVVLEWSFLPVAVAIGMLATIGTGAWRPRWRRVVWLISLGVMAVTLYYGVQRHEWGEVLFNGQLL